MKKKILYALVVFLFIQCKSSELTQITKLVKNTTSINFLNPEEFESGRRLMLEKLNKDHIYSDTIIILEKFSDGQGGSYNTTIYESNFGTIKSYYAVKKVDKLTNRVDRLIDSLASGTNFPETLSIIKMVKDGRIDEVKLIGDNSTLTPQTLLIVHLLTKDKKRFSIKTIKTSNFMFPPNI